MPRFRIITSRYISIKIKFDIKFISFIDYTITIAAASTIGKLGTACGFGTAYMYTAEIFPTSMRSFGIGTCATMESLGAIIAPFAVELVKTTLNLNNILKKSYIF